MAEIKYLHLCDKDYHPRATTSRGRLWCVPPMIVPTNDDCRSFISQVLG